MGYGLTMGWDFLAKPWFDERTSVFMRKIKVWKGRKPSCCRKIALFSFSLAVSCEAKELSAACSCFLPPGVTPVKPKGPRQRSYSTGAHMSEVNIPSVASTAGSSGLGMAMAPTRWRIWNPQILASQAPSQCYHSTIPIIPVLCASPSPQ